MSDKTTNLGPYRTVVKVIAAAGFVKIVASKVLIGVSLINVTPGPKSLPCNFVAVTLLYLVEVTVVLLLVLVFKKTVATTEVVMESAGQSHWMTLAFWKHPEQVAFVAFANVAFAKGGVGDGFVAARAAVYQNEPDPGTGGGSIHEKTS